MSRVLFQIEQGLFGLSVVDRAAVGYSDDWQAPDGLALPAVSIDDYEGDSRNWSCQIVGGVLSGTPDTTTTDVPASWCAPGETIPTPGLTSYELTGSFLQDPNKADGLSMFLYKFDTAECFVYVAWGGDIPPRAIGRVRLAAGDIGGEARTNLTSDFTLPFVRRPDIEFGDADDSEIVLGAFGTPATGATAGTPGSFTPAGSDPPASPADLISGIPNPVTASPATAWTTGQYVQTATAGTGGRAYWNGTAWVAGTAT